MRKPGRILTIWRLAVADLSKKGNYVCFPDVAWETFRYFSWYFDREIDNKRNGLPDDHVYDLNTKWEGAPQYLSDYPHVWYLAESFQIPKLQGIVHEQLKISLQKAQFVDRHLRNEFINTCETIYGTRKDDEDDLRKLLEEFMATKCDIERIRDLGMRLPRKLLVNIIVRMCNTRANNDHGLESCSQDDCEDVFVDCE
ncbi:hypothetical protein NHQ30_006620 [Ciborinia camelliae]|nr:hypothetical protein NHQ30_006620 [Ciborinia camelliae]